MLAEEPEAPTCSDPFWARRRTRGSQEWWASCEASLRGYFDLEDPRRLEPAERESYVETVLEGSRPAAARHRGPARRHADGEIRIVDYKTGRAPGEGFEARAMFQMRFYALVLWRTRGVVPRVLRVVYLGSGEVLSYSPDEDDLRATQRKIEAVWRAMAAARDTGGLAAQPQPAVRLVSAPGHLPGLGRHAAARPLRSGRRLSPRPATGAAVTGSGYSTQATSTPSARPAGRSNGS